MRKQTVSCKPAHDPQAGSPLFFLFPFPSLFSSLSPIYWERTASCLTGEGVSSAERKETPERYRLPTFSPFTSLPSSSLRWNRPLGESDDWNALLRRMRVERKSAGALLSSSFPSPSLPSSPVDSCRRN